MVSKNSVSADEAKKIVCKIVLKYAPRKLVITDEVELLKDVRVWGDDACDLLSEFSAICHVDMSDFVFQKFFRGEGAYLIRDLISKINGIEDWKRYKPIKISHLAEVALIGRWYDPY